MNVCLENIRNQVVLYGVGNTRNPITLYGVGNTRNPITLYGVGNTRNPYDLNDNNPNECLESIKILGKAIGNLQRRGIYYSSLQGKYLACLKKMTLDLEDFKKYLLRADLSYKHASFLIRFHDLVLDYKQLLHCELPLRFFLLSETMKKIKDNLNNLIWCWEYA